MRQERIPYIDAWRLLAVLMVIVYHVLEFSNPWYRENLPWIIVGRAQSFGLFGVKIFFCISGFVICRGMLAEVTANKRISMRAFYIRRAFRILPPLLLYMGFVAIANSFRLIEVSVNNFLHAGAFLCNFDLRKCGWFFAHTWSLAYEEQFYLAFPIVFIMATIAGGRRAILILTLGLMGMAVFESLQGQIGAATAIGTFCYMLVGCNFAMYWREAEPLISRISTAMWVVLVATGSTVAFGFNWSQQPKAIVSAVILPPIICLMVLSTPTKVSYIRSFFLNPFAIYLGKISFTVYLWQQLATSSALFANPWLTLVAVAMIFPIAGISYHYYEKPMIKFGVKLSDKFLSTNRHIGTTA